MSNLDGYHPFRASVQPGSVQAASGGNSSTSEEEIQAKKSSKDDEDEYKPWFSWKTKLRLFIGSAACGILYYVGSSAYGAFAGEPAEELPAGPSMLQEMQPKEDMISEQQVFFDKTDLDERGRTVQEARQKAGFFKSIFCKGGKRSSFFCDS
jgi:hypothetical protein